MKKALPFLLTLSFLFFQFSCQKDDDSFYEDDSVSQDDNNQNDDDNSNNGNNNNNTTTVSTFGIRHDKSIADYEAVAASNSSANPTFGSVVAFNYSLDGNLNNAEFVATGTLIDQNWILTAGHNFFTSEEQNSPAPASGIEILVGNDPNDPDAVYEVEELVFHPTWISDDRLYESANDLCLVKLKTPVTNLTTVPLFTSSNETIGSRVWYCGFGDYSQTSGQNPNDFSKKHAYENILDRKVDGITTSIGGTDYNGGLLGYDFDDPAGTINSLGDSIVNDDEALLGSGTSDSGALEFEAATVQGDSGGPLFVMDGNTWKLAGILSGGATSPVPNHKDGDYGDISFFIRVSSHIDWINSVIQ